MELSTLIAIALIVGAIAFILAFNLGRWYQDSRYASFRIFIEKPSYMTEESMRKLLMEQVEVCMITEGLVESDEDEDFKYKAFTFYIKDNG